jgi:hypothetical protein
MKTTNHTPGPWEIETCNENGPFLDSFYIQTDSKHWDGNDIKRIICRFPTGTGQFGEMGRENLSNAHLIASAPDLLSALIALEKASREVLDTSATHDGLENCKTLLEARIAIQKAKGEA